MSPESTAGSLHLIVEGADAPGVLVAGGPTLPVVGNVFSVVLPTRGVLS